VLLVALLWGCAAFAKDGSSPPTAPDRFLIALHTFIDVGPPNDFYEIISAHGTSTGTTVEKLTLAPAGDACLEHPTVEMAASVISDPIGVVLEGLNPCAIDDRALQKELKRREQGLVFSGAEIFMHVQCEGKERILRADVLDRDMFDPNAATPENTSLTMRLLARLDKAFPNGVLDRPVIAGLTEPTRAKVLNADTARALASGEYDQLFVDAPDRPSDLYRASQAQLPVPEVLLRYSEPFQPEKFLPPGYPPLARLARVEGAVIVTFQVDANGGVIDPQFESGSRMLRGTVEQALSQWKFPKESADHRIKATIDFRTNCPPRTH
ncbi:MAG: TonB family protein, partial [Terriglobales bacterium]